MENNSKSVESIEYNGSLIVYHKPRRPEAELLVERKKVDKHMDRIRAEAEESRKCPKRAMGFGLFRKKR